MCGVGLLGIPWFYTGGYTYLHRDVPFIIPMYKTELLPYAYNYALADPRVLPDGWPYTKVRCWSGNSICVYHREEGGCDSAPGMEANESLRRQGQ